MMLRADCVPALAIGEVRAVAADWTTCRIERVRKTPEWDSSLPARDCQGIACAAPSAFILLQDATFKEIADVAKSSIR